MDKVDAYDFMRSFRATEDDQDREDKVRDLIRSHNEWRRRFIVLERALLSSVHEYDLGI